MTPHRPAPNPGFSKSKHSGTDGQGATAVASPQQQTNRARSTSEAHSPTVPGRGEPSGSWGKQQLQPALQRSISRQLRSKEAAPKSNQEAPAASQAHQKAELHLSLTLKGAPGPGAEGAKRAQVRLVRAMMGSPCPQLLLNPEKNYFQAV